MFTDIARMFSAVPTFIPPGHCLSCRGCCVFAHSGGDWSPRLTTDDISMIAGQQSGEEWRDGDMRLALVPSPGGRACCFLDQSQHTCRVYPLRPLECRIYPLLLSSEAEGIRLYVHEACPYVRTQQGTASWRSYLARAKAFFSRPDVRRMLAAQRSVLADYSKAACELEFVCDVRTVFPESLLSCQPLLQEWANRHTDYSSMLSSRSFAALFMWQDHFDFVFHQNKGALWVEARQPVGSFCYLASLSEGPLCLPDSCRRVENVPASDLSGADLPGWQVEPRGHEYVYRRKDIVHLRGNAFKSQRHEVNMALRISSLRWRAYQSGDRQSCLILLERWLDRKKKKIQDDMSLFMLEDTREAHAVLWDYTRLLELEGRVAEDSSGRLLGYTFGARLNQAVFCVLAEVADPDYSGLSAWMFHSFAADPAVEGFEFINVMDDAGQVSLAAHKMSWNPVCVLPVCALRKKEGHV